MKDFLSINDCSTEQLKELLRESAELKRLYKSGSRDLCLCGRTLAMLFEKPSLRTRISFQVAMTELGGDTIYVKTEDVGGIGKREPIKDMAQLGKIPELLKDIKEGLLVKVDEATIKRNTD